MPSMRSLRLPVPVTIITGSLASGKTTFIGALLRQKPQDEVWAVLVNEFGAVGLDAALLEGSSRAGNSGAGAAAAIESSSSSMEASGSGTGTNTGSLKQGNNSGLVGIHIKQLAGGCLCCALSNVTVLAIAQLLRNVKPDRLIIEPSGLAHPSALVDMLQGEHLGRSLALQPVVCLVDATQFNGGAASPACCAVPLLADQISIADVLVGSRADLCEEPALASFSSWAAGLFPPKLLVATARQGQLNGSQEGKAGTASLAALLSWPLQANGGSGDVASSAEAGGAGAAAQAEPSSAALPVRRPRQTLAGQSWLSSSGGDALQDSPTAAKYAPIKTRPLRKEVKDGSGAHAACGWIFHRDCMFDRSRLLELLRLLVRRTLRLKGVFRVTPITWVAVSAAPQHSIAAGIAASNAEAGASSQFGTATAAVELNEIAYRGDSRVEVIIDVTVCAACSTQSGNSGDSVTTGALQQQVAQLSLADGDSMQRQVAAALGQAAAGDWGGLELLLQQTLTS